MARRARMTRRFRRGDAEYVWCADMSLTNTVAAGAGEMSVAVDGADWSTAAGKAECVLQRVRASVGFDCVAGSAAPGTVQLAWFKTPDDATAFTVPMVVGDLVEQDLLYFRHMHVQRELVNQPQFNVEFDIPVKRRLSTFDNIIFFISYTGTGTLNYTFASRSLVKL